MLLQFEHVSERDTTVRGRREYIAKAAGAVGILKGIVTINERLHVNTSQDSRYLGALKTKLEACLGDDVTDAAAEVTLDTDEVENTHLSLETAAIEAAKAAELLGTIPTEAGRAYRQQAITYTLLAESLQPAIRTVSS
jgi:hypothetical protein